MCCKVVGPAIKESPLVPPLSSYKHHGGLTSRTPTYYTLCQPCWERDNSSAAREFGVVQELQKAKVMLSEMPKAIKVCKLWENLQVTRTEKGESAAII